jgi:hypothetical protein
MKFIATILAIYILALVAVPCVDQPEDRIVQKMQITQNPADNHQNDCDQCSPFCTCDCCVSPIIWQNLIVSLDSFSILLGCFSPEYSSAFVSCYSGSIWQPPQLS